jgi:hypothetical protein
MKILWRLMFLLWVCFALVCNGIIFADTIPDGISILTKIRETRQLILSGHVEIKTSSSGRQFRDFRKEWTIWFDGDNKRRSDVIQSENTTVMCLDCYAEQTDLHYTTLPPTDPNTTMALVFYDGYSDASLNRSVPDPRWFGCLVLEIENSQYHLSPLEIYDSSLNKPAEHPTVVSDICKNVDCWKVDWRFDYSYNGMSTTVPCTLWVDKSDTSHILRVESRFESNGILYIDGVDSESEKYQNKIWFPTKLTYQRTENGKITASQNTQINVLSLNEPLPPDTFSPKGISFLKPGTPVSWAMERDRPVEKGELVWDGNNVVSRGTFEIDKIIAESTRFKPINIFFMLLGVALILFGIGMKLWKKYGT